MSVKTTGGVKPQTSAGTDTFTWTNQAGGAWSAAANWFDSTTQAAATLAPGAASAVVITGGAGDFIDITGAGSAASLALANDVLLWGTVAVGGAVSVASGADVELDGGATLSAAGLTMQANTSSYGTDYGSGTLEVSGASALTVSGTVAMAGGGFMVIDGASAARFGALVASDGTITLFNGATLRTGSWVANSTLSSLSVDATSAMEIGGTGGAALGAVTVDKGATADVSGAIHGNVVVNGVLAVQADGDLTMFGTSSVTGKAIAPGTVTGTGTLSISESGWMSLGADSAAIQFAGPNGGVYFSTLPTGAISGFTNGDTIDVGFANAVSAKIGAASTILTLTENGAAAGTITLNGVYTGDLFHMSFSPSGDANITLRSPGTAPAQPGTISGTAGQDTLSATASGQTLIGLGGGDAFNGGGFAGVVFKDTSANLNGATIINGSNSDVIDLTDMTFAKVTTSYTLGSYLNGVSTPTTLVVSDGTHNATLTFPSDTQTGYFTASSDGGSGTDLKFTAVQTVATANNQTLGALGGSETLYGESYTGIDFKATSAKLTGATIQGYVVSDIFDLTDMAPGTAVTTYTPQSEVYQNGSYIDNPGTLTVSDGTHTASVLFPYSYYSTLPTGYFATASDGAGGTDVTYVTVQTSATANNQTLGGVGGTESLFGNGYTGIDFKGPSARLSGATIAGFDKSDTIDLTDMKPATATVNFVAPYYSGYPSYIEMPGTLTVGDGTHSVTLFFPYGLTLPVGYFATGSDGAGGTDITYVAVNQDAFAFIAPLGGGYATVANWQDTTTSAAATIAPGYGNAVTLAGGASYLNVTGNGFAASLTTSADVLLWGTLAVGAKVSGVSGSLLQSGSLALDGGASLTLSGTANIGGYLEVGGGSKLVAGSVDFSQGGGVLLATNGSTAQFANLANAYSYATRIAVDSLSSIEFGTTGAAAKGAITVDSGQTVQLTGTLVGNVVVNGTLLASGLTVAAFAAAAPSITGSGTIQVAIGTTLTLNGSDTAAIALLATAAGSYPSYDSLALNGSLPTGTISGFVSGDTITLNQTVTSVSYSQTTAAAGTLTLMNGTTKLGTLALAGTFSAGQFQVQLGNGGASSSILYSPTPNTSPGTQISSNTDNYNWTNVNGGVWSNAANWSDNGAAATTAPGSGNAVSINDSPAGPPIISGTGAAASLNIYAATVITGDLTIANALYVDGSAVGIAAGAVVTAGSLTLYSALDIGGASTLDVTSWASLQGSLTVHNGSHVAVAGPTSSNIYQSAAVAVDATSSVEFGTKGGAAAGALTVDNGQTLTDSGTIEAAVVVNGLISAEYSSVIEGFAGKVGSVTGTGTIEINYNSASYNGTGLLVLDAASSIAIDMLSYSYSYYNEYYGSTLEIKAALPTGVISGFAFADAIRLDQTVTGVSFKQTTSTQGTLTLTDGATTVGTLALAGSFTGEMFHLDVSAATGVATLTLQAAAGAAGTSAASTGTDAFAWTGASGGVWSTAANWRNSTTSSAPAAVPGAGNAVTIAGTTDSRFYTTIGGNGAAASLAVTGNVLLTGTVAVAGQTSLATASGIPAKLALDADAKLTSASLSLTGTLAAGGASTLALTGGATLAGGTLLAMDGSSVTLHGLTGNGGSNTLGIDASSTINLGTVAAPVAGALNFASGAVAAYTGSIFGNIVDNGYLQVAAGGAAFIDMAGTAEADPYAASPTVSGGGQLSIGEGATLGLGAADSAQVKFSGPNGTLQLATTQVGSIYGFAAGDSIVIDQTATGLTVTQSGGTAVLTVMDGAATVATLKLAYTPVTGQQFHLDTAADGASATITLQTIGIAAAQPTLITGTQATDLLYATANGQTLTGLGGGDTLSGAAFSGLDFKDLTANLNGSAIQNFATSDTLDFTDLTSASATVAYSGGKLSVSDGTHSASLNLGFLANPSSGSFHTASDGATGTLVSWH